ncbi:cathelicidin-B1 precursor [Venturia nashicola]|uniref:Cathelicidin-B1 n=1 Tax=Venturia nashicola TaxID=86259 RepID=A0A4Z1NIT3_9PEZI|nr:cathelicidin-B1 precursor [Venturia nashicola]
MIASVEIRRMISALRKFAIAMANPAESGVEGTPGFVCGMEGTLVYGMEGTLVCGMEGTLVYGMEGTLVCGMEGTLVYGMEGTLVYGMEGTLVYGMEGTLVYGMEGTLVYGMEGTLVYGMEGTLVCGMEGTLVYGMEGTLVYGTTLNLELKTERTAGPREWNILFTASLKASHPPTIQGATTIALCASPTLPALAYACANSSAPTLSLGGTLLSATFSAISLGYTPSNSSEKRVQGPDFHG